MVSQDPPKFGDELKRARKASGLTLDELSGKSGVSKSILSQIERDATNPTLATVWRICHALDYSPEQLFQAGSAEGGEITKLSGPATPEISSADGLCRLRILGAIEMVGDLQWYELLAEPGGALVSEEHGAGSTEHLTVLEGEFAVEADGNTASAKAGETLRYRTDSGTHIVRNIGLTHGRALMVCRL